MRIWLCTFDACSELSIYRTDDSRMVDMPISFRCACVKFVIHWSSQFYNTCKGPDNSHCEDAMFDFLPLKKPSIMRIKSSLLCIEFLKIITLSVNEQVFPLLKTVILEHMCQEHSYFCICDSCCKCKHHLYCEALVSSTRPA